MSEDLRLSLQNNKQLQIPIEAHSPPLSLETTNRSSVLVTIAGLILFTFKIPDSVRDNGFRCGRFNNPTVSFSKVHSLAKNEARDRFQPAASLVYVHFERRTIYSEK